MNICAISANRTETVLVVELIIIIRTEPQMSLHTLFFFFFFFFLLYDDYDQLEEKTLLRI